MEKRKQGSTARARQRVTTPEGKMSDLAIEVVLDVPIEFAVKAGSVRMTVREVGRLKPGLVLQLDTRAGQPVDLLANGHWIGQGELVVVNERYGVRITRIGNLP